ncbi:flagellar basal body rod protein FlgB [Paraburkholderia bonniea]|uniref:flagellar basal body rod protein FlgB n=1 Tax=Paraburkholderia bonniea TaxID=2152891 RepID=UPI00129140D8|nr:flagellar basal body rod protein FlgB [Paraburkholderia bonniea]WJF90432.1 flagellar basal body rod protein FlgB [Paraburkholderia bonniea]WJF93747.1 flagellar basal body rod protein FlgB [Paraburkholderia bonniea]
MLDRLDAEFAFGREALDVRAHRQALLSSNIANADTPGYQARDVDFAASLAGALRRTMGASGSAAGSAAAKPVTVGVSVSLATTAPGHLPGTTRLSTTGGTSTDYGKLLYRTPAQPALDGNTVDLDMERVQFADNTLHYQSSMTLVSQQIKSMLSAITSGT